MQFIKFTALLMPEVPLMFIKKRAIVSKVAETMKTKKRKDQYDPEKKKNRQLKRDMTVKRNP